MIKILLLLFLFSLQTFASHKFTYSVPDIVCETCENAINKYLKSIRTLISSTYDKKLKTVVIELKENKPLTEDEMKGLDNQEGYRILEIKKKTASQEKPKHKPKLNYKQKQ